MPSQAAHIAKELSFGGVNKKGDTGSKVRRVQEWLLINKFPSGIDGVFGDATESCVTSFQQSVGLPQTGTVNQGTWKALVEPLNRALTPIQFSAGTSRAEAILQVAQQHLAEHPVEAGGDNSGPWVRIYLDGNQGPAWRWCAGFVTFVIKQACAQIGQPMPVPGSYSCDSLAYQAKEAGIFVRGTQIENGNVPWSGLGAAQIFLVRKTATDWVHTGFSFGGANTVFSTIEGNTNEGGSANGYEVARRTRSVPKKDFIKLI